MYYLKRTEIYEVDEEVSILSVYEKTLVFLQGGVTEEQMLKFMGANTNLSPVQAKELIEVNVAPHISFQCLSFPVFLFDLLLVLFFCNCLKLKLVISGRRGWFCLRKST